MPETAALINARILERPMSLGYIPRKANISPAPAKAALARIGHVRTIGEAQP